MIQKLLYCTYYKVWYVQYNTCTFLSKLYVTIREALWWVTVLYIICVGLYSGTGTIQYLHTYITYVCTKRYY